jgi:hypothetical protein
MGDSACGNGCADGGMDTTSSGQEVHIVRASAGIGPMEEVC